MIHLYPTRCLLAASVALLFAGGAAAGVQIDTFQDDLAHIVASLSDDDYGPPAASTEATPYAVGGFRTMAAEGGTGWLGTLGLAGDGMLHLSNGPCSAGELMVSYGEGIDLGLDLTDGGEAAGFFFTVEFADALIDYSIEVISGGGPAVQAGGTLPGDVAWEGEQEDIFISFSAFAGVDFTQVDQISITFSPTHNDHGADLSISNFRTDLSPHMPEPSSLALLGLGGLLAARRRRRG